MSRLGFNLLRPQLSPPTSWDKIYQWMVGTARIIVLLVELVVIAAFGIRVVVDTIGKNLDKDIERKQVELEAYKSSELQYLEIQNKTDSYRTLWEQSSNLSEKMVYVNELLESYYGLINVKIDQEELSITGELPLSFVRELENSLKLNTLGNTEGNQAIFNTVELIEVDSKSGNEGDIASFSILARFTQSEINRNLF